MSDTVVEFPKAPEPPGFLVGPFEEWRVVVDGRFIPKLTGVRNSNGTILLVVDHRFGVELPNEELARSVAFVVAQALAVGAGYTHLGADAPGGRFAPMAMGVNALPEG